MTNASHLSEEELPVKKNLAIQVLSKDANELVHFLITKQISFRLSFACSQEEPHLNEFHSTETVVNSAPMPNLEKKHVNIKETAIRKIYEKYISSGFETPIPTIDIIAGESGFSLPAFKSKFKTYFGQSFYQCYMEKRMEHAAKLLSQGYRATEVSKLVGYTHPIKFNKMFQKHFGMTPKKYQMKRE